MKTLLVTTGKGMFGSAVINALAGRDGVQVRAMVRDVDSYVAPASNVVGIYGDMDKPETLAAAVEGVTDIFLVSPMDEHIADREINVTNAAKSTGTPIRILKLHGAVEHRGDHLSQLHQRSIQHLKDVGLNWTLICPNSVMETCFLNFGPMISSGTIGGTSGHGKVGFVALRDVGEATAVVVTTGGFIGQNVMLTGPRAEDMYDVAADFTAVLGKPVTYEDMPEDDYANLLIAFGVFPDREAMEMAVLCHYRAWARGDAALVADGFHQVTGKQPTSVSEWIDQNRSAFA